jgi:WD40 repeat protein
VDPDSDSRVDWWDLEAGLRLPVPGPLGQATNVFWHALLSDGVTVVTCARHWKKGRGFTNELTLWEVGTGERIGELALTGPGLWPPEGILFPHLSSDGRWLAFGHDRTLWLFDVPSRSLRHQIVTRKLNGVLALHPNGRLLACAVSDSQVALWDFVEERQLERFDWKCGKMTSLAFAPDGQTCAAGARGRLVVWDVDS